MKKFIQILTVSSLILLSSLTLFAEDNDGKAKDNPVCDSGYPNNFEGASYYDMAIPYALTNEEIGGYSTGGNGAMSDATKKEQAGQHWNREGDHASQTDSGAYILHKTVRNSANLTITDNSDGFCVATDTNGTEYLILALPKFFYNSSAEIGWDESNRGQVCEIYFTDGKFLRVIVGDVKAEVHTNGGGGDYYEMSTLNYSQYACLYQAYAGETFEWFCKSGTSSSLAKMAGSSGQASYVRMYNLNVATAVPTLASGAEKGYSGASTSSGGNLNTTTQSEANSTTGYAGGFYTEMDLSAYTKLVEENIQASYLDNATRDNLSQNDLENLASWEDNVTNSKKEYGFIACMRIIVMWVGIIFTIYIFLIYLAYWFDKLNSIIDLDVLSILTFGRLHVAIDDKEANFSLGKKQDRMTVSHKDMLFICITGLIFGTLLITGTFYKIVASFVNFILRSIG